MIYQSDTIKTTIATSTVVASAAGVADWASHVYVRYGEEDMTGNTSVGRLPVVTVREVTTSYTFEAEPEHQGSRNAQFVIRVYVPSFMNRSESQWKLLERVRTAILSELTKKLNLGATDAQTATPVITQVSIYQDITITTDTSYDQSYAEGN